MNVHELSMPSYMTSLTQDVVDRLHGHEGDERIIASGIDPRDGDLVFVTSSLGVFRITPNGRMRPETALPCFEGRGICLTFKEIKGAYVVASSLAIQSGSPCVDGGDLFVNDRFVCKVDL